MRVAPVRAAAAPVRATAKSVHRAPVAPAKPSGRGEPIERKKRR
jgi:hypothetical protein